MEERLEGVRGALARTRERLDSYTVELQRHGLESVEREVRWRNELIVRRRSDVISGHAAGVPERDTAPRNTGPEPRENRQSPAAPTHSQNKEYPHGFVRVAIVGVGNCAYPSSRASSTTRTPTRHRVPGLMHVQFGEYHVGDVEFVAAFDVDAKKVGQDLAEAIVASENNTIKFSDVPPTGITVQRGPTLDGLGKYYRETITESDDRPVDVPRSLRESKADVLVCYLPVGSEDAARYYAQAAIDAGVGFVNALPVFIAGTKEWADKFTAAGVPIVGDDIKSQVGATITHRVLAKLFEDRGRDPGPHDAAQRRRQHGLHEHARAERLESKKISKTQAVTSQVEHDLGKRNVHIGPSDHVAWLDDRKMGLRATRGQRVRRRAAQPGVQARGVGLTELGRCHHRRGALREDRAWTAASAARCSAASSYFMKSPPVQYRDDDARNAVEEVHPRRGGSLKMPND